MKQAKNINDPQFAIDYGITYLAYSNLQLDLSMGLTFQQDIFSDVSDYIEIERFLECGISFRLP